MKRTTKNPKQTIIQTLARLKEARWNELQMETKLSKGALSKNLNLLVKWGQVVVGVNTSTVPKTITYSLAPIPKFSFGKTASGNMEEGEFEKQLRELAKFSVYSGYHISMVKDRSEAKNLLTEYLTFNLDALAPESLLSIVYSLAFSRGFMRGKKRTEAKMQYEVLVKELMNYCREFIEPWIESMAFTAFNNGDLIEAYKDLAIKRGKEIDVAFFDKMIKLHKSQP